MENITVSRDLVSGLEYAMVDLSIKIERATCIMQDLTEEYFSINFDSPKAEEKLWELRAGYEEHSIKAEIVSDYIFGIKKESEKIEKMINELLYPQTESKLEKIINELQGENDDEN